MNPPGETRGANLVGGRVTVADDVRLWTETWGAGPVVLVMGGIGSGTFAKTPIGALLAEHVKMISYDRRVCGRSIGGGGRDLDPHQAAQDALAILDAYQIDTAAVLTTCAGAAIALELLTAAPDRVSRLLLHEPLLTSLLTNDEEAQRYEAYLEVSRQAGPADAMSRFLSEHDLPYPDVFRRMAARDGEHWLEHEFLPLVTYRPDFPALRRQRDRIVVLAGRVSVAQDLSFARIATTLAERLGVPRVLVPGNHSAYYAEPDEFTRALVPLL